MPVSRTVQQTVNALVKTYKKEIETAAGDNVLSKSEQAKLSPFAKSHINELRVGGKPVTVNKAVAQLKPVLTRAVASIAGRDGMVDAADVQKLRVAELRTRAASLFEGSAPSAARASLDAAVKRTDFPRLTEYGMAFGVTNYPAGTSLEDVIAKETDITPEDMGPLADWGDVSNGPAAVKSYASLLRKAAKDQAEGAEDAADAAKITKAFGDVATAVTGYFNPSEFKKFVTVSHSIAEDGDLEQNLLVAQKKDGSWVALNYTDFPF